MRLSRSYVLPVVATTMTLAWGLDIMPRFTGGQADEVGKAFNYNPMGSLDTMGDTMLGSMQEMSSNVHVKQNQDEYALAVDVPGFTRKEIEVNLSPADDFIHISANKSCDASSLHCFDREIHSDLRVPPSADTEHMRVVLEDGVLYVHFPKKAGATKSKFSEFGESIHNAYEKSKEYFSGSAEYAKDKAEETVTGATERAASYASEAGSKAGEYASDAAYKAGEYASDAAAKAREYASDAGEYVADAGSKAREYAEDATEMASGAGSKARQYAGDATDKARQYAEDATDKARQYAGDATDKAREYANSAGQYASDARNKAGEYANAAGEYASDARDKASDYASDAQNKAREYTDSASNYASDARNKANQYANTAGEYASDARDKARQYADNAASDARDKANEYYDSARENVDQYGNQVPSAEGIVDNIKGYANKAGEKAQQYAGQAGDKAKQYAQKATGKAGEAAEKQDYNEEAGQRTRPWSIDDSYYGDEINTQVEDVQPFYDANGEPVVHTENLGTEQKAKGTIERAKEKIAGAYEAFREKLDL